MHDIPHESVANSSNLGAEHSSCYQEIPHGYPWKYQWRYDLKSAPLAGWEINLLCSYRLSLSTLSLGYQPLGMRAFMLITMTVW